MFKIGHKNFTEQRIVAQMISVLIETETGKKTEVTEFGGTNIVFEALKNDEVDIYPEYTGTAYGAVLAQDELKDPQKVYDYVKEEYMNQWGITWGGAMGFNNTYTFAVRPEIAQQYNLKTFSDLSKVASELRMISTTEFMERSDGLPGIKSTYGGFEFKDEKTLDPGLRYAAIDQNEGDVMDAFSTDGKLIEFGLVVLEDDKNFFPPYYAAALYRKGFAEENKDIYDAVEKLAGMISDKEMQELNFEVDNKGTNERTVAENFLKAKGLIK